RDVRGSRVASRTGTSSRTSWVHLHPSHQRSAARSKGSAYQPPRSPVLACPPVAPTWYSRRSPRDRKRTVTLSARTSSVNDTPILAARRENICSRGGFVRLGP